MTAKANSGARAQGDQRDLPLVVNLDLHANVTPEMVEHADALIRTTLTSIWRTGAPQQDISR
jgi:hypothetical protein